MALEISRLSRSQCLENVFSITLKDVVVDDGGFHCVNFYYE